MKTISNNRKTILGLWKLFRIVPVLTFSGTLMLINVAFAGKHGAVHWHLAFLLVAGGFLINGFLGHALNDINDWESGTDQVSRGILSGGSKVIKEGLFYKETLNRVALWSLSVILLIGFYLYLIRGSLILAALAIGVLIAWAYTCPPLRLAYKPFLGELMGIWLSGVVLSTASYFVLTGGFHIVPFFAGIIQTTLLVGWLMQHHIPDIPADLSATPRKLTTPALFFMLWGPKRAALPSMFYFSAAASLSLLGSLYIHKVLAWMMLPCLIGIWAGVTADAEDVHDVTKRQLITTAAIVVSSIIFAIFV